MVTTPIVVNNPPDALPPATAANPKLYGFQQYAALGVLQYSRGPNNAVPTPVTFINSPSTALSISVGFPIDILDFTGITRAYCKLYAMNTAATFSYSQTTIVWNGSSFTTINREDGTTGLLIASSSGNILRLGNSNILLTNAVYWTLEIKRLD